MAKMSVEFNDQVTDMLEELARREGRTKVEILRRALGIYKYLDDEVRHDQEHGRKVAITDKDHRVLTEIAWF